MNEFDEFIRAEVKKETDDIPPSVREKIRNTLDGLPEKPKKAISFKIITKLSYAAAALVFVCLVALPNISSVYAEAIESVPVLGKIAEVVTVRNYFYSDSNHEMNINVPKVSGSEEASDYINKSVDELTQMLSDRFYEELDEVGDEGHSSIYVNYDVVTDTDVWFTLKIEVFEAAGSSNTYYKYYHIDKKNGKTVTLGDIAESNGLYSVLEENIKDQMRSLMSESDEIIYWVDSSPFGDEIVKLDAAHNFYWNEDGDMVIVFDKYEVAPGSMGTPEFTVAKSDIRDYLKEEYK